MKELVLARRYANAFFSLALDEGKTREKLMEMNSLLTAARHVPPLLKALGDRDVHLAKRISALEALAEELALTTPTLHFLKFLMEAGRVNLLPHIGEAYQKLQEGLDCISSASVVVAEPSAVDEVANRVSVILRNLLGRDARCDVEIDQHILGGCVVKVGDIVFDASVKGRLERMKEELLH